ncbi:MAG: tRNA pseudouridine38-40 synthase [Actinomycetota bacterium]|nr:tRNA pseudouridine38-40 synthase [Actinomycetota bacterium]
MLKLTVAYDGTGFHGFAAQPEIRTVEGVLTEVLARILRHDVVLTCAGRTDAGVHAWGQVVSVPVPAEAEIDLTRIVRAVNGHLGPEVVVRDAELVDASFDARRSAKWRAYRYSIVNRPVPDPFLARTSWWVPEPLELSRLRLGADPFLGEHDFATFCRRREGVTTTRRVLESTWHDLGDGVLRYDITATAFCWQMVRSIVGTLVDVGAGKIRPGDILGIIRATDRSAAGRVGAPEGLCLWEVGY